MYLKEIEIQGFKSFPERTRVVFHTGMTAIVGPNGSGKSNVTDAIRWVLGEQSAKTLRGQKMEDVIFSGTQSRRPLSYAEVTILFDNAEGGLPLPYREVAVTRRLYRSGESEYRINQAPCRLKDIHALFLDTGLGRDGYSIVGQGRVDELLSARSEDRRRVFEEAAGIAKLRMQKEETERKLQQTEQNLERLQDILGEVQARLDPLRSQAEKARRFLQLQADLRQQDLSLAHRQMHKLEEEQTETLQMAAAVQKEWEQARAQEQEQDQQYQRLSESLVELSGQQERLQQELDRSQQRTLEQTIQSTRLQEERKAIERETALLEERSERMQESVDALQETHRQKNLEVQALLQHKLQVHAQVQEAEQALSRAQEENDRRFSQQQQVHNRLTVQQDRLYQSKMEAVSVQAQLEQCLETQQKHKTVLAEAEILLEQERSKQSDLQEKKQQNENLLEASRAQHEEAKQDLEEARALCAEREQKRDAFVRQKEQWEFRHQTLTALEESYAGYSEAVSGLLRADKGLPESERTGILGTVAELLKVPHRFETAIEIALGAMVQNIVTAEEQTAARCIAFLKEKKLGRATFLPLDVLKPRSLDPKDLRQAERCTGYLGIASEQVETVEGFVASDTERKNFLQYILGNTLLVDDQEHGRHLAKETGHRIRIVTLQGELFSPGGALTGGSLRSRQGQLLSRTRELEELKEQLLHAPEHIREWENQLQAARTEFVQCGTVLSELEEERAEAQREAIRLQALWESTLQQVQRAQAQVVTAKEESERQRALENQLQSQLHGLQQEQKQVQAEIDAMQQELGQREEANRLATEEWERLREARAETRLAFQTAEAEYAHAQEWLLRLQQDLQMRQADQQADVRRAEELEERLKRWEAQRKDQEESQAHWEQQVVDQKQKLQFIQNQKQEQEANRERCLQSLRQQTEHRGNLEQERTRLQTRQEQFQEREEAIRRQLWEGYALVLEQLHPEELVPDDVPLTRIQKQAEEFRRKIRALGPVNPQAIEEYQQLEERERFLAEQRADIVEARDQLKGLLQDSLQTMRTRFTESFARINENFDTVFRSLFGGGKAEVLLQEDVDVLDAGIEIKASPPGKRLQNMLLLSGGERSLTAIALLFAILNLRPTPFVVLDEIEAALDDANVLRFTDYIHSHSHHSQFVLVTHRKGTMEACDRIYGVTMQERGVSRILSMQLSDQATGDFVT